MTQLATPVVWDFGKVNTNFDSCIESQASHEWPDYDDFPSSEDLSAFLADLEKDAFSREAGQALPSLQHSPQPCVTPGGVVSHMMSGDVTSRTTKSGGITSHVVTSDEVRSGEMMSDLMTSKIATLHEVVSRLSQASIKEDYTEFTNFPSSEDLDAFLADLELDCENIPMGKSLAPIASSGSGESFHSKLHYTVEEYRVIESNEHMVEDIVDADHTKHSRNILNVNKLHEGKADKKKAICDMDLSSDSFCLPTERNETPPCCAKFSSNSDKTFHDTDFPDSQCLRDCESVFTELTEGVNEKDGVDNKLRSYSPVLVHNDYVLNDQESPRQTAPFSSAAEELREEIVVCDNPLEHEEARIKRSHDRDTNEPEDEQGSQTTGKGWTLVDHHGSKEEPKSPYLKMAFDSFEVMTSSPNLFSQSVTPMEQNCCETPELFSSPRPFNGESRSFYTKHLSGTPDLFLSTRDPRTHTYSRSRQEMNSVSLFSCPDHSHLSSSSPFSSPAFPDSFEHESDQLPSRLDRNSQTVRFHSTPYGVHLPSNLLRKIWTPARVSPLLSDSRAASPCNDDISLEGTPILFSPMSSGSL